MLRFVDHTLAAANRSGGAAALLTLSLVLSACAQSRSNEPWPEARSVPDRPAQEYTLAERQAIRSDLTRRGAEAQYNAESLRYRVGLQPTPPAPLPPVPKGQPGAPVVQPPPAPPNVTAAYLKQQIETEVFDDDLTQFLYRLPDTPIDVDAALASGTLRPLRSNLERVTLKRFEPVELEPSYPQRRFAWLDPSDRLPPLNRLLKVVGVTPQPRLAAPLQTPEGMETDERLGRSRINPPNQNQNTITPLPSVPPPDAPTPP